MTVSVLLAGSPEDDPSSPVVRALSTILWFAAFKAKGVAGCIFRRFEASMGMVKYRGMLPRNARTSVAGSAPAAATTSFAVVQTTPGHRKIPLGGSTAPAA